MKKYLILVLSVLASSVYAECITRSSAITTGDSVSSARHIEVCRDEGMPSLEEKTKIGDTVFEDDLEKATDEKGQTIKPEYFTYKFSKCRLFRERYTQNGKFRLVHGTICQINKRDTLWTVVDRW